MFYACDVLLISCVSVTALFFFLLIYCRYFARFFVVIEK